MNANSHSEAVWQLLHQAGSLLTDDGFAGPAPALPARAGTPGGSGRPAEGYLDLGSKYGEFLEFGTGWPAGLGSAAPLAVVLTEAELTEGALGFVRSWFENSRVNLVLAEHFFVQPLPTFGGAKPPYQEWARDVCALFRPKALLSLGALPAQRLLGAPLSLDSLRGSDYRFDKWSMITTLDPELFLTLAEEDKAKFKGQIWKDLQRLLGKLRYG
jgi:hypothetical protein